MTVHRSVGKGDQSSTQHHFPITEMTGGKRESWSREGGDEDLQKPGRFVLLVLIKNHRSKNEASQKGQWKNKRLAEW